MDDLAESAATSGAATSSAAALRRIPRTDLLLADPRLAAALADDAPSWYSTM